MAALSAATWSRSKAFSVAGRGPLDSVRLVDHHLAALQAANPAKYYDNKRLELTGANGGPKDAHSTNERA
jgi:hypothetical protein